MAPRCVGVRSTVIYSGAEDEQMKSPADPK
jgi:hypothetical protein